MIKRILALSVSLVLSLSMLSSCASDSSSSDTVSSGEGNVTESMPDANITVETSLVIDGEEIDTDGLIMCTIAGIDITFDEFRYYWLLYYDYLEHLGYDFEKDSEEVLSLIKYNVMNDLTSYYGLIGMAKDNGCEYKASTSALQDQYMTTLMKFQSETEYAKFLEEKHLTDDAVQSTLACYIAYDLAYDEMFGEGGKFFIDNDALLDIYSSDKMIRCVHILIPYSACTELSDEDKEGWDELSKEKKYDKLEAAYNALSEDKQKEVAKKSLELAESVLEEANNGKDFFSLIEKYNYDPGMEPDKDHSYSDIAGYYFTRDYNYVQEFIDAAFALKEDEISPVVTSEAYGYHILLRLPIDMDYVKENIDSLSEEYNAVNAGILYDKYLEDIETTYSEYFDKLTLDSIS